MYNLIENIDRSLNFPLREVKIFKGKYLPYSLKSKYRQVLTSLVIRYEDKELDEHVLAYYDRGLECPIFYKNFSVNKPYIKYGKHSYGHEQLDVVGYLLGRDAIRIVVINVDETQYNIILHSNTRHSDTVVSTDDVSYELEWSDQMISVLSACSLMGSIGTTVFTCGVPKGKNSVDRVIEAECLSKMFGVGPEYREALIAGIPMGATFNDNEDLGVNFPSFEYGCKPDIETIFSDFMSKTNFGHSFGRNMAAYRFLISKFSMFHLIDTIIEGDIKHRIPEWMEKLVLKSYQPGELAHYPKYNQKKKVILGPLGKVIQLSNGLALASFNPRFLVFLSLISSCREQSSIMKMLSGWMLSVFCHIRLENSMEFGHHTGEDWSLSDIQYIDGLYDSNLPFRFHTREKKHSFRYRGNGTGWWLWDDVITLELATRLITDHKVMKKFEWVSNCLQAFYDDILCSLIRHGDHVVTLHPPYLRCRSRNISKGTICFVGLDGTKYTQEVCHSSKIQFPVLEDDFDTSVTKRMMAKDRVIRSGRKVKLVNITHV
jgi:hypothetical protein